MSVASPSPLAWQPLDLTQAAHRDEAWAVSKQACAAPRPGARAFNLAWRLGTAEDWTSLRIFVLKRDSTPLGLAIFSRRRRPLKFLLGEITLAQVELTRYWHLGDPYLDASLAEEAAPQLCASLLEVALSSLSSRECLFLEGLPTGGPLHGSLTLARCRGVAPLQLGLGNDFEHQFIRMPQSLADYLAQMGGRSRQSVQYSQRKLVKDMQGDVRCDCFDTEESIERFVADAQAISRKTYQWNLLGLGLRDGDALRASLRFTAQRGWMRSFILYCKQVPVAFMLGDQQENCYYYDDVGYDPAYAKSSVGSVLQLMVLEFLFARADRPAWFDFSTGYGEHKGRFGNFARHETNLLVMPATLGNRTLVGAHRLNDRASRFAVDLLARAGVKDRLKQLIRRRSARKSEPQPSRSESE
jgi:hypothetical protein